MDEEVKQTVDPELQKDLIAAINELAQTAKELKEARETKPADSPKPEEKEPEPTPKDAKGVSNKAVPDEGPAGVSEDFDYETWKSEAGENYRKPVGKKKFHSRLIPERRDYIARWWLGVLDAGKKSFGAKPRDISGLSMKAAWQEDTTTEGGYFVPEEFLAEVAGIAEQTSFMLQRATKIPMRRKTLNIPKRGTAPSVAWEGEEDALAAAGGTIGQIALTAKKLACYEKISDELLEDSAIDVVDYLSMLFGEVMGKEIDNQCFNGTGDPVSGIGVGPTGVYSVVFASGSTHFSEILATNLSEAISNIHANALSGALWILHRTGFRYLRDMENSAGNRIYADLGVSQPSTIDGYPFHLSEAMPTTDVDTCFTIFGNPSYFYIGDKGDMRISINPWLYWVNDQSAIRAMWRIALDPGVTAAFCRIVTAGS